MADEKDVLSFPSDDVAFEAFVNERHSRILPILQSYYDFWNDVRFRKVPFCPVRYRSILSPASCSHICTQCRRERGCRDGASLRSRKALSRGSCTRLPRSLATFASCSTPRSAGSRCVSWFVLSQRSFRSCIPAPSFFVLHIFFSASHSVLLMPGRHVFGVFV